jgi:hypothetical protein
MTRDEIRGLIGGYATGSLSEAERKILFDAALEDQELFDELAGEQALKEALEEPGAKQRLLGALTGTESRWKNAWALGVAAAASVALIAGVLVLRPTSKVEKPEQIAQVERPALPEPDAPVVIPRPAVPAPKVARAPVEAAPVQPELKKEAAPAGEPAAELQADATVAIASPPAIRSPGPQAGTGPAPIPQPAVPQAAPQAVPQTFAPQAFAQGNAVATTGTLAAPPAEGLGGGVGGGGGGGGRGGGRGGRAGAARAAVVPGPASPRFAFNYGITPEGALRITPAANGFLAVYSNNGNVAQGLFFDRQLQAGSSTEIPLPADCTEAMVAFSARPRGAAVLSADGPMDPASGTKSDPNPSPDSVLIAVIPVKR